VSGLPSGTVTFLFTDVEGSTRLLHELGAEAYADALAAHRATVRAACARHGGVEVDTQGDAFFVAFPTAPGALAAAAELTEALAAGPIRVRVGLHTGTPLVTDQGYVGADVHRAARIAAAGHGGQVLVSAATATLCDKQSQGGLAWRDLGEHRFKDLAAAERVFQLGDCGFPPLKSLYRSNLPVPATPFLGRERELDEIVALLDRDDVRLLTLTGPGGAGKTRLALQAAAESAERYPDGVWWVPLASLRDASAVRPQILQTIGATDEFEGSVGEKRMLLVLDNLEHLLGAAPGIASLIGACAKVDVLATSRELLQLQSENAYVVPPLSDHDGVSLFVSRARAVSGEVSDGDAVADLCRRLDNLPLAIELAAARSRHLTLAQLRERLSQRLDFLRAARDVDPRQRTLRATIEWSHGLLEDDERRLFARLSVFAGGCTLEAAEAVCETDLETLSSLIDKSLVRKSGGRFWMLQTVCDFAAELLEATAREHELRRRHAEFFLEFARSLGFTVESIEAGAVQRHEIAIPEEGNFRAAIGWALEADVELALRIATALENFWVSVSPFAAERIFAELAARVGDGPPDLLAHLTRCRANLAVMTGATAQGLELYDESLRRYAALGDEHGVAIVEHRVAANVISLGDSERGRLLVERSIARSRANGFRINEAMARGTLGSLEYREGNIERGFEAMEESLALARDSGFRWWQANMLNALAGYAAELDRTAKAEEYGRAVLALASDMGDRRHAVQALGLLATLAIGRGDACRAGRLWGAAEAQERLGPLGKRPRMAVWEHERERFTAVILADSTPELARAIEAGRTLTLEDAVAYAVAAD
jgi:predicted ATPase/class 3 adenylate cyclase